MQGILVVDKPAGWTSFDVVAKMRGVLSEGMLLCCESEDGSVCVLLTS